MSKFYTSEYSQRERERERERDTHTHTHTLTGGDGRGGGGYKVKPTIGERKRRTHFTVNGWCEKKKKLACSRTQNFTHT